MKLKELNSLFLLSLLFFFYSCGYNNATLRPNITYIEEEFYNLSADGKLVNMTDGIYYVTSSTEAFVTNEVELVRNGLNIYSGNGHFIFEGLSNQGEKSVYSYNGDKVQRNKFYKEISHHKELNGKHYVVAIAKDGKSVALSYAYYGELETVVRMSIDKLGVDYRGLGQLSDITLDENGQVLLAFSYAILRVDIEDKSYKFIYQDKSGLDIESLKFWNGDIYYLTDSLKSARDDGNVSFSGTSIYTKIHAANEDYLALSGSGKLGVLDTSDTLYNFSYEGSFIEGAFDSSGDFIVLTKKDGVFGVFQASMSSGELELLTEVSSDLLINNVIFDDHSVIINTNLTITF